MTLETPPTDVRSDAMRLLSNGLYVLTACLSDTIHAATISWVSQVSFEPPLVMVVLGNATRTWPMRCAWRTATRSISLTSTRKHSRRSSSLISTAGRRADACRPRHSQQCGPLPPDHRRDGLAGCRLAAECPAPVITVCCWAK